MKALSNFSPENDLAGPADRCEYRPARPDEVEDALALVLGTAGMPAQRQHVLDFLQFAIERGIDVHNLWVAGADGRLGWAMLPILSPGRTMLLLAPATRPDRLDPGPLIEAVCQRFAARQIQLAQSLVEKADGGGRELYARHGFSEIAELLYLHVAVRRTASQPLLPRGWSWQTYSPESHAMFAQTILESYRQSLDCPALNGIRNIEDILAGHKASGEFDPQFWFLLRNPAGPQAVLLLNRVPRSESAELVYLGLVPAARGRGTGDLLMRLALWAVRQMGLCQLTLAVDANNAPALRLYYRHGMQQVGTKIALMRDLSTEPMHRPCTGPINL